MENNAKRMKYNETNYQEIRESDGFKIWYNNIVIPRMTNKSDYFNLLSHDGVQDQMLLSHEDTRSHIYQYKQYCANNN